MLDDREKIGCGKRAHDGSLKMQKGHETRTVRRRSRTIVLAIDTNRMAKLLGLINIYV